jgi:uncharacterized protein (TIGR02646 family)
MRSLCKGAEPATLQEARSHHERLRSSVTSESWNDTVHDKQAIRDQLHRDQHGLCAYCCARIGGRHEASERDPGRRGMKIDHWEDRSSRPAQAISWGNLVGACIGLQSDKGKVVRSCDTHRGNAGLALHPYKEAGLQRRFVYTSAGHIQPRDPRDSEAADDIQALHLDNEVFRRGRAEVIAHLAERLRQDDSPQAIRRLWRIYTTPDEGGLLPDFVQVAWHYLDKKARRHGLELPPFDPAGR